MKIAMIIAFRDFRDEEYFIIKQVLEATGAKVTTVSTNLGKAIGAYGGETEVDLLIADLEVHPVRSKSPGATAPPLAGTSNGVKDFDAIVFIGGAGAYKYIEDPKCLQIALETVKENKVLGAICIAPIILAKAGVLKGKKATVWSSSMDRSPIKILKEGGAIYQDEDVVVDGKIVTASGPAAAKKFGEVLTEVIKRI